MNLELINNKIQEMLPEKRYKHSLNVANCAVKLSEIYGCDKEKAYIAGIAHDCAKYLNKDEVKYKTNIQGNYRWRTSLDRETGVMTIHFEQSLWEKYVSCIFYPYDHIHDILKKDEIKEVYVDKDGTTTTIWEAPEEEQKAYLSEEHTEPLG